MSNLSTMVWATKFKLNEPISVVEGTYKINGAKKALKSGLVSRQYVEDRNSHPNNEHYVIDEEKTAELMAERDENIINNAEKAQREKISMADLVDAVTGKAKPSESKPKKVAEKVEETPEETAEQPSEFEAMSVIELHQYCTNNEIKIHHKAGKDKLIETINKHK